MLYYTEGEMASHHEELLQTAIAAVSKQKPRNIYFVACGGSLAFMHNQQYIIDRETDIPSFILSSNEFVHRSPRALGPGSLVITCSHSGNTPETVEATRFAREKGALTLAYSFKEDSPLWQTAEYNLHYDWGPDSNAYDHRSGMALRFIFGFLNALQPKEMYAAALETVKGLQDIMNRNKEKFSKAADAFGLTISGSRSSIPWDRAHSMVRHIHLRFVYFKRCNGSTLRQFTPVNIFMVLSKSLIMMCLSLF